MRNSVKKLKSLQTRQNTPDERNVTASVWYRTNRVNYLNLSSLYPATALSATRQVFGKKKKDKEKRAKANHGARREKEKSSATGKITL